MHTRSLAARFKRACVVIAVSAGLLFAYDRAGAEFQLGSWQRSSDMPIPVAEAAAVADPTTGLIYLGGGYVSSGGLRAGNQFQIYNPAANTWTAGPDMPLTTRGADAVYQGGRILIFGNTSSNPSQVQIYDIEAHSWSTQAFAGRWELSATAAANGKIYIFGGEADGSTPPGTNTTTEYNVATATTESRSVMPITRKQQASGLIDGGILVVGGNAAFNTPTSQVDLYDPQTDTWSTAPADLTTPRLQFASGVLGGHFMVAGGSADSTDVFAPSFSSVEVYDPVANLWSAGPSLPISLRECAGAVSGGNFYVLGGFQSGPLLSPAVYRISVVPEPALCAGIIAVAALRGLRRVRRAGPVC